MVRPGVFEFIEEMSKCFEIVVFTSAMKDYADNILNDIDKNNRISYRLYRNHCTPNGWSYSRGMSYLKVRFT
jgi:CTD small phosphatase-like protein 2